MGKKKAKKESHKKVQNRIRKMVLPPLLKRLSPVDRRMLGRHHVRALFIIFKHAGAIKRLAGLCFVDIRLPDKELEQAIQKGTYGSALVERHLRVAKNCATLIKEIKTGKRYIQVRFHLHQYGIPSPRKILTVLGLIAKRHVKIAFAINRDACFRMLTRENGMAQYRRFCIFRGTIYQH